MLEKLQEAVSIPGYQKAPDVDIILFSPEKKELGDFDEEITYYNEDEVKGQIFLYQNNVNIFKYKSIVIELLANIHTTKAKDYNFEFINISKVIDNAGEINSEKNFIFDFGNITTELETFNGSLFAIEYKIKVTITQQIFGFTSSFEKPFIYKFLLNNNQEPKIIVPIKHNFIFQSNINECLSFSFELLKNKFFIGEPIVGRIICEKIKFYVRSIELILIRNEKLGEKSEDTVIAKYEICDGFPFDGEILPIRFYIDEINLSPTVKNINNGTCWIKYYLKIVIHFDDIEENNNLYKSQEIILYRNKKI